MDYDKILLVLGMMNQFDTDTALPVICMMIDNISVRTGANPSEIVQAIQRTVERVNAEDGPQGQLYGYRIHDRNDFSG